MRIFHDFCFFSYLLLLRIVENGLSLKLLAQNTHFPLRMRAKKSFRRTLYKDTIRQLHTITTANIVWHMMMSTMMKQTEEEASCWKGNNGFRRQYTRSHNGPAIPQYV